MIYLEKVERQSGPGFEICGCPGSVYDWLRGLRYYWYRFDSYRQCREAQLTMCSLSQFRLLTFVSSIEWMVPSFLRLAPAHELTS
jgi:hypothetical protein